MQLDRTNANVHCHDSRLMLRLSRPRTKQQLQGGAQVAIPLPDLVLQVSLVRKVNQPPIVDKKYKGRRIHAGLCGVVELELFAGLVRWNVADRGLLDKTV